MNLLKVNFFNMSGKLDNTTPNSPGHNSSHTALPQAQHADMEQLRERERLVDQLKMQYHLAQKLLEPQEDGR